MGRLSGMAMVAGLLLFALAGRASDTPSRSPNDSLEIYETDDKVFDEDALFARFRRQGWVSVGPYRLTSGRLDGKTVRNPRFAYWPVEVRKPVFVGKANKMECRLWKAKGRLLLIVDMTEAEIDCEDGSKIYLMHHHFELPVP